jgi:hypothetical protein
MRRRPATRWNVHVDQAESACRVFAVDEDGVGVSDDSNVRKIAIGLRKNQRTTRIVRRNWRTGLRCL